MKLWVFIIGLAIILRECNAAKILAVLPVPIISHQIMFRPILRELANRGHEVTVITMSPEENANYKQIVVKNALEEEKAKVNFFEMRHFHWIVVFTVLSELFLFTSHQTLKFPEVEKLIHSTDQHFDLILVESTFYQEAYIAFGHKFKAPVIELSSFCTSFWLSELTGNPYTLSHTVEYKTTSSNKMNFYERLKNTFLGIGSLVFHRYIFLPKQEAIANMYFNYTGSETRPPLRHLLSNISLVILNSQIAMHYAAPNNPNIIEVAGIHIKPPKKLPQELQSYLDNAKEGVIYFSLGSNVKSSMMPEHVRQTFLSAFTKLPYKVLWKWEEEFMPNMPSNVKISKWLPQTDILPHPNIKAYISHGGLLSLTESVHHGIPLIIIPLFADQFKNGIHAETSGFGIILDFDNITEKSVIWSLNELISKPSFKKAAIKHSRILKDNPLPPMETAMYWIEYIIRHKGAPHLRTAAVSLPWYKYFLIDVIAVLTGGVVLMFLIIYRTMRTVFRLLCRRKNEKRTDKASKNTKKRK